MFSSQLVLFDSDSHSLKHTARLHKTRQRLRHCDLKSAGWVQGPVAGRAGTVLTIDLSNGAFKLVQRFRSGTTRPAVGAMFGKVVQTQIQYGPPGWQRLSLNIHCSDTDLGVCVCVYLRICMRVCDVGGGEADGGGGCRGCA